MTAIRLLVTQGDPTGIGPEIIVRALAALGTSHVGGALPDVTLLGDPVVFANAAKLMGVPIVGRILPSPVSGMGSALWALEEACRIANAKRADAIVTAPIHKADLTRCGFTHPGQTEFLGERLGAAGTTMLLAGEHLRVALVTTHLRLRDVPAAVTAPKVEATIRRLHAALVSGYRIARPRIGVLGLNPHAGEEGLFGDEEILVIAPVVKQLRAEGMQVRGPLPGDGTFAPRSRSEFDGIVAMYHDQGLAGLKAVEGGNAVNVTLGLPLPRTSPDHGTARDIAGLAIADAGSMSAAIALALRLARVGH